MISIRIFFPEAIPIKTFLIVNLFQKPAHVAHFDLFLDLICWLSSSLTDTARNEPNRLVCAGPAVEREHLLFTSFINIFGFINIFIICNF